MIVVLDTNALHADPLARRGGLSALLEHASAEADFEVLLPTGVYRELVRQYPARLERMGKIAKRIRHDLNALDVGEVSVPENLQAAAASYETALRERFSGPGVSIAPNPKRSGEIVDWVASRRHAIKEFPEPEPPKGTPVNHLAQPSSRPVSGVVDAAIWLTVLEALEKDQVALITRNSSDFGDASGVHSALQADLGSVGSPRAELEIFPTVLEFNKRYVVPAREAQATAEAFFDDPGKIAALEAALSDAAEWFTIEPGPDWRFGIEVDDASMTSFDVESVKLVRGDVGLRGVYMTVLAKGSSVLDLGIRKSEAYDIADDSEITVYDWDWNETMVQAQIELGIAVLAQVRLEDDDLAVSFDVIDRE